MMDESKHTEDGDLSRFDFANTTLQDTTRNLHQPSALSSTDLHSDPTIDLHNGLHSSPAKVGDQSIKGKRKPGDPKQVYSIEDEESKT